MSEFKVGDKVVLRPETKPYTFINCYGCSTEKLHDTNDFDVYTIMSFDKKRNAEIGFEDYSFGKIDTDHLKHVEEEVNQLRLDIFRTNPSLSVLEMQDIENWLLNK